MNQRLVRRAVCALLLAVPALPAQAAPARCDITQLESLTLRLGTAPTRPLAGRTVALSVDVVRAAGTAAELAASGIDVLAAVTGAGWGSYDQQVTDAQGRAVLRLTVPRTARGAAELDVEAYRVLLDAPCLTVEEHGGVVRDWGRAR